MDNWSNVREELDVDWPDTYIWAGLVVADAGTRPSPIPSAPPSRVARIEERATVVPAAPGIESCRIAASLDVTGPLAPDVTSVVVVGAPQQGPAGARVPLDCAAGTTLVKVPRAVYDAWPGPHYVSLFSLELDGGPIVCDAGVELLPCARAAGGRFVSLAPAARFARAGLSTP